MRIAVAAGVVLLLTLAVAGPAAAAGAKSPHRIIFDPAATASWTQTFQGSGASYDGAFDVAMAKGGVTYVAGYLEVSSGNVQASLAKFRDGAPVWSGPKTYDGPAHNDDVALRMALGPGGTIYTAGLSIGAGGMPDMLVVKWSSSGAVLWARRYNGPSHGTDQATSLGVDAKGNVSVAGMSSSVGGTDWVVVNWSSSGTRRWVSRYTASGPHHMMPASIVVAGDRSVYASGISATAGSGAAMTVKYSPAGRVLWKKTYKGPSGLGAEAIASVARPGGGVYVCGATDSPASAADGLVMSYTAAGARDVFALDNGPGGATDQALSDLAVTSTGQVVAVGSSTSALNQDCHAVWFSTVGTIAGQATLPGAWTDEFVAVAADSFGGFYVSGFYHTAANKTAVVTLRGSVLTGGGGWASLWAPAFVSDDNRPRAIAVRGSTTCVVGECNEGPAQGVGQFVLGYVY
jgi:hypothetical protein